MKEWGLGQTGLSGKRVGGGSRTASGQVHGSGTVKLPATPEAHACAPMGYYLLGPPEV